MGNPELDELPTLGIPQLNRIYELVDQCRAEEVTAAQGRKVAHTRLRLKLSEVAKLCKEARAEVMKKVKKGGIMEKYGVDEAKEGEDKTAEPAAAQPTQDKCPKCGADLERHGNVAICPNCGSEPFEQK